MVAPIWEHPAPWGPTPAGSALARVPLALSTEPGPVDPGGPQSPAIISSVTASPPWCLSPPPSPHMALGPGPRDPTLLLWPLPPRSPKVPGAGPLQGPCSVPSPTPSLVCSATASVPFAICVQVRPPPDQGPRCPWDPVESPPWPQPWGPRPPGPLRTGPPAPAPRSRALDFYRPCSCLGSPPPGLSTAARVTCSSFSLLPRPRMPASTLPGSCLALCLASIGRHRTF